ncbi:MAG: prepilin-type N-terminal cleavage/methylation domain-containing protein [Elusimicrobiaceae bacterium]|nr:prepilin-type N-terminal cleavage/methylation domain-containing protein [Elusimicrobiaceae bacterium]
MKNRKGFSLVELMAVVLIIAILAAIGLPAYQRAVLKSRTAEVNNLLMMVRTRQNIKFAQDKEYAQTFNDQALRKIALGPSDYENNQGVIKIVNQDYELELINNAATEETPAQNCVIGRYKPQSDNETKFTLAIAYTKHGLACEDGPNSTWSVCGSLGNVVSNSIDEVCAGEAPGQIACPECPACHYSVMEGEQCGCRPINVNLPNENWQFDGNVSNLCMSCKYCEGDDCPSNSIPVEYSVDTTEHKITGNAGLSDTLFECTDPALTLGNPEIVGYVSYDATQNDQPGQTPIYGNCHSAYYKEWSNVSCGWVCNNTGNTEICNGDQVWNNATCSCTCKPGTRCICHVTQQYDGLNRDCTCKAPEAVFISKDEDPGCKCESREEYGEDQGDRVLNNDYTHCQCGPSRQAVYFGTVTDKRGNEHPINISDAETLADKDEYWNAACCLHDDVWKDVELKNFAYNACCPYNKTYKEENNRKDIHVAFDVARKQCCPTEEPFFNDADNNVVQTDPRYENKPAGTYQTNICHKCSEWSLAYNEEIGCHKCPGKTFTTWDESLKVSQCSCPTGTEGQAVVIENGQATETCKCTKLNTSWNSSVKWIDNPTTRTSWHINNGACKCNKNYEDVYYGLEIQDTTGRSTRRDNPGDNPGEVDFDNGFCCPANYVVPVLDDNNNAVAKESACCPKDKPFFHRTTFAKNTCGVCRNQTDTYVDGRCQKCPGKMIPVYDETLGYAKCECPIGTEPDPRLASGQNGLVDICKCKLTNATWKADVKDWLQNYIDIYITQTALASATMPGNWHSENGYCACNGGYTFADHGQVGGVDISSAGYCCQSTMPAAGQGKPREAWHTSNANPAESFCCDFKVAFNPEFPNAQCCSTQYYYNLITLNSSVNNLNATTGGCAACSDPRQTWTEEDQCQDCEYPKIPSWNNNPAFGYSNCSCPPGSQEVAEPTPPTWWQSFLNLFGLGSQQTTEYTAVLGHCQCVDENSVWVNGVCQCPTGFSMDSSSGHCCPTNMPYYWQDNANLSSNPGQMCHKCPSTQYEWGGSCHDCPQGQYYVGGRCCNENIDPSVGQVYVVSVNGVEHCSVCPQGQIYAPNAEGGPCITPTDSLCTYGIATDGTANCECSNGAIWSPENGCNCSETDQQCNCNKCRTDNPNEGVAWLLGGFGGIGSCGCDNGRVFKEECCMDTSINCCQCPSGTIETPFGNAITNPVGCCASNNVAPNNNQACCGQTTSGVRIHYNTNTNACCPQDKPFYISTSGEEKCVKCLETQYWNGVDNCDNCPFPLEPSNWNANLGAYTECSCPAGTSMAGLGAYIYENSGKKGCRCNAANTIFNEVQGKCECASGYSAIYGNDGVTITSCCPTNRYHNGQCCPENTTWNEPLGKCVLCQVPNTQIVPNCTTCSDIKIPYNWDDNRFGYTNCKCPVGDDRGTTGEVIQYYSITGKGVNGGIVNSSCRCPQGEHFTDDNYVSAIYTSGTTASCKPCPAGAIWTLDPKTGKNSCQCPSGFTLQGNQCVCSGTDKHAYYTFNLHTCNAGSTNCVCATCPSNTIWDNEDNKCRCINVVQRGNDRWRISGGWTNPYFLTNQENANYTNLVSGQYVSGYCHFSCPNNKPEEHIVDSQNVLFCPNCHGDLCDSHLWPM